LSHGYLPPGLHGFVHTGFKEDSISLRPQPFYFGLGSFLPGGGSGDLNFLFRQIRKVRDLLRIMGPLPRPLGLVERRLGLVEAPRRIGYNVRVVLGLEVRGARLL